jgi:hypothetical protein
VDRTQTVSSEVLNRNKLLHTRLKKLIQTTARRFFFFNNEHHRETYFLRLAAADARAGSSRVDALSENSRLVGILRKMDRTRPLTIATTVQFVLPPAGDAAASRLLQNPMQRIHAASCTVCTD